MSRNFGVWYIGFEILGKLDFKAITFATSFYCYVLRPKRDDDEPVCRQS